MRLRPTLLATLILAVTPLAALAAPIATGSATLVEGAFQASTVDFTVTKELCGPVNDCLASPAGSFEYLLVASHAPDSILGINAISALFPSSAVLDAGFVDNPLGTAAPVQTKIEAARVDWVFAGNAGSPVAPGAITETLFVSSDLDLDQLDVFVQWEFGLDGGTTIALAPIPEPSAAVTYLCSLALIGTATRARARRRVRAGRPGTCRSSPRDPDRLRRSCELRPHPGTRLTSAR